MSLTEPASTVTSAVMAAAYDNHTTWDVIMNLSSVTSDGREQLLDSNNQTQLDMYAVHRPAIAIVDKYVTPLWYVIGFPGNLLAFVIWIQRRMRHSSGCYLAALAMADFVFLIFQLMYELHTVWSIFLLNVPGLCEIFPIFFLASQYMSPLLVLGFTVERYISICHPFKRERYCTTRRAVTVIFCLVASSLCLNAIQAYFWTYKRAHKECDIRDAVTAGGPRSLWSVWSWVTELLVFGLVPLTILVLNILVMKEARIMKENEEKRMCLRKGQKSSGPSATTFMLLAVSFYLILTTLPVTILYVLYLSFPMGDVTLEPEEFYTDPTWQRHFTYWTIKRIVEELGMSHYALNFYIYVLTGKMFRRELRRKFLKWGFCRRKSSNAWNGDVNRSGSGKTRTSMLRSNVDASNGKVAHL